MVRSADFLPSRCRLGFQAPQYHHLWREQKTPLSQASDHCPDLCSAPVHRNKYGRPRQRMKKNPCNCKGSGGRQKAESAEKSRILLSAFFENSIVWDHLLARQKVSDAAACNPQANASAVRPVAVLQQPPSTDLRHHAQALF